MADADINMKALFIADTADFGIVRIFCDTPKRAVEVLGQSGLPAPRSRRSSPCPSRMLPALWPIFSDSAKGPSMDIEFGYCFCTAGRQGPSTC
ncbi:MAG: hypothetical protein ACLTDR_01050 [Adlercreutzia equolifaciens]